MRKSGNVCNWPQRAQKYFLVPVISIGFVFGFILTEMHNEWASARLQVIESDSKVERRFSAAMSVNISTTSLTARSSILVRSAIQLNTTVARRWFEPQELLKSSIQDLEETGYEKPKGNLYHRIKTIEVDKPSLISSTVSPKDILATSERWKVAHIGCFFTSKTSGPLTMPSVPSHEKSAIACVKRCSAIGRAYSSISAGKICTCGSNINRKILMSPVPVNQCNIKCQEDKTETCGGHNFADIYRVAVHSREILTIQSIRQTSAGCFVKPTNFDTLFLTKLDARYNIANCLLHCEKAKFVIAAQDTSGLCHCGQFDSKFPLSQMGSPVNDSFCDGTICQGVSKDCDKRYVRIMRTYSEDKRCESKKFLPPTIGRLAALISFPGSGNTWVRYLIESASGIFSGSVYSDVDLYTQGFIGEVLEWNSRRTSVIKTHLFKRVKETSYEAGILIVRSPYDAIMAEFNRIRGGHVGFAEPELFKTMEWVYFVSYKMPKWFKIIEDYLVLDELLLVYFEDIVANPIKEVRKMVNFLKYPVENLEDRLACLETNLSGNFKRPKRKLSFDPFPQSLKNTVNEFIKNIRELLVRRNLPPLPAYEK